MNKYIDTVPVDLVYLWVDDTDYNWKKKINRYRENLEQYDSDATDTCRFYNNDELKYSLRSAEKNIPWINRIFIVTDEQTPDWLNTNHPKITVIDHKEIIPTEKLPLFNSCAIESRIPFIPGLSEHFIYANDDMFAWKQVDKNFFFTDDGKAICRIDQRLKYRKKRRHLYGHTLIEAHKKVAEKYPLDIPPHYPHHNIDAYLKSAFIDCINAFKSDFDETLNHRFRERSDIQRMIVSFYMIAKGLAVPKSIRKNWFQKYILKQPSDSSCFHVKSSKITQIAKTKSALLCINDSRNTTDEDRKKIRIVLESKFPDKSSFEL